jgi:hypothetical protein
MKPRWPSPAGLQHISCGAILRRLAIQRAGIAAEVKIGFSEGPYYTGVEVLLPETALMIPQHSGGLYCNPMRPKEYSALLGRLPLFEHI